MPQSIPYDIPMALDQSLDHTLGLEPERAKSRNRKLAEDARNYTLGPIPVIQFLGEFLSPPDDYEPMLSSNYANAFRSIPSRGTTSTEIYEPLIRALNRRTKYKARCPGFIFRNASTNSPLPRKLGHMKPDVCCYMETNMEAVDTANTASRAELGHVELFIEVKPDPLHDFFVDPPSREHDEDHEELPAERDQEHEEHHTEHTPHDLFAHSSDVAFARRRDRALGQHIHYVTEIFARQHRAFVFSISMSGSRARFLRWDRAGCIVSASFDVREEPEILCEFLWRFSHASLAERGHDATVIVATPEEEELFRDALRDHVRIQLEAEGPALDRAVSEHYQPGHASVVHVFPRGDIARSGNSRRFVVSRPVVSPLYPTGRGTRGYWAVDVLTRQVVFLKDTWRAGKHVEGLGIAHLNAVGVRNVPSLFCHGDVPDYIPENVDHIFPYEEYQCTMTDEFCLDSWPCEVRGKKIKLGKYWHYRIVLGTVGYGLKHLNGTEELLHATYDVFQAMKDALKLGSRLHRDISIGNIILVREKDRPIRRGYLIDWDASYSVDDSGVSMAPGRAGTWLFMSQDMLAPSGLERKQTIQDDMESLLYVVLYCSFLWLPHNLSKEELARTIKALFESASFYVDDYHGGDGKFENAAQRKYTRSVKFNPDLTEWLDAVMDLHSPLERLPMERSKWSDPDQLDKFWAEFLRTHTLESHDRVMHDHPHATQKYNIDASGGRHVSTEVVSLGKRASQEEHDEIFAPTVKRYRPSLPVPSVPAPLRRSGRIRQQPSHLRPPPPPPPPPRTRSQHKKEPTQERPRGRTRATHSTRRK